jgi:hypothetical protein
VCVFVSFPRGVYRFLAQAASLPSAVNAVPFLKRIDVEAIGVLVRDLAETKPVDVSALYTGADGTGSQLIPLVKKMRNPCPTKCACGTALLS